MLIPAAGYILIEPIKEREYGGLTMPDSKDKTSERGQVLACGAALEEVSEGKIFTTSCPVRIGEMVYYKRYSNHDVKQGTKVYHFVHFTDIIGWDDRKDEEA